DDRKLRYYADNSNDSRTQIDTKILEYVDHYYQDTLETSSTNYIQSSQGEGMLVHYEKVDKKTIFPTTSTQPSDVFFVVVSVSLDKFNALRKQIEFDYQTSLFFTSIAVSLDNNVTHS
ncbi:diguanylate phosphodiesterase, partial [Vibrio breoganii]